MSESRMIVQTKGSKEWISAYWINKAGLYHRIDGPAIEYFDGTNQWYFNGLLHREGGPAIEWASGIKEWWLNGLLHRVNGPAIEYENGSKEWYQQGKRHRVDGPAIEMNNGEMDWLINGIQFSSQEKWFEALDKEDQIAYLFNMEGSK